MNHSAEDARAANAVARAVAAEAGSGATDTIAVGCGLVRFGLFFDGTGNSRKHVDAERWHTNVDLLERTYRETGKEGPQTEKIEGRPRKVRYMRHYMRGIGVMGNGWSDPDGLALGIGYNGVERRVNEAINDAIEMIRKEAGDVQPCDVWFDLMGFSRGACAARYFANRVKNSLIRYEGGEGKTCSALRTKMKVMALFDTVSSIGTAGNTKGHGNVRIETSAGTAETTIHLTAKDEIRKNFPLTLARFGARIELIGAHADIGGGYVPTQTTDKLTGIGHQMYWQVTDFCRARWNSSNQSITWDNPHQAERRDYPPIRSTTAPNRYYTVTTTTEPGLQFVALRVMHQKCVEAGMPLKKELGDVIDEISIAMPADLQAYYSAVVTNQYEAVRAMEKDIRSKYGHFSARNVGVRDKLAHMPVSDARRRYERL